MDGLEKKYISQAKRNSNKLPRLLLNTIILPENLFKKSINLGFVTYDETQDIFLWGNSRVIINEKCPMVGGDKK